MHAACRVKICCIADSHEARLALAHGAAAVGLVSAMPSGPGVIADAAVAEIAAAVAAAVAAAGAATSPAARSFLLTARTAADAIAAQQRAAGTTTLQLVDHVPHAELQRLRRLLPGVELVQVVHVPGEPAVADAVAAAPFVDAILLDSGNPALAVKQLGGTGRTHDWALSRRIRDAVAPLPLWLAGGLHAGNVAAAIAAVQPHGVDVCSGVRSGAHNGVHNGGKLDAARLAAFMRAVVAAAG